MRSLSPRELVRTSLRNQTVRHNISFVRSRADIFGHYINEGFHLCSGLIGLVSCGTEHHTGDYVKNKTEEVLLKLGIAKVGHDDGIFQKVADNDSNMVKGRRSLPY